MASHIPHTNPHEILSRTERPSFAVLVFGVLNIVALVLVALVLCIALASKRIRRNKTWYMYMFSQLLFAISFLLQPFKTPYYQPTFAPCLIQAMLTYSTPPTASWAFFSLLVELYLTATRRNPRPLVIALLLAFPILILLGCSTATLVMALKKPSLVKMGTAIMFCTLGSHIPSQMDAFTCLIGVTFDLLIFCLLAFHMYRHWKALLKNGLVPGTVEVSLSTTIRVGVLIFLPILGFFLAVVRQGTISQDSFAGWNCVLPVVPIASALVFGTQKDMLSILFCMKDRKATGAQASAA